MKALPMRSEEEELICCQRSTSCCAVMLLQVLLQHRCWRRWSAECSVPHRCTWTRPDPVPIISLFTTCYLLVKHNLLFPAPPKTRQDLSPRPVVCFPWSRGSQLSSGSCTIKMAVFLATKLCPGALTNPGTEPCKCDLDAAQPAWGTAEKIPDCLGLPGCHTPPLWLYTQSTEGNDPETMFSTQSSLVNIMKSYCRPQQQ